MPSLSHSSGTFTLNCASSNLASDLLRRSHYGASVVPLKSLGRAHFGICRRDFTVSAKGWRRRKRPEHPWDGVPDAKTDGEVCRAIHPFKALKEKPKPIILEFEKPLIALRKQIAHIKKFVNESQPDSSDPMISRVNNLEKALEDAYRNLTPIQRVYIARHPHRPTSLDHIFNITDDVFVELHGDRHGYDDPAVVTGLGRINDTTYMFIGLQKGRNSKESIHRNFAMPTPHGYRKAQRMMHYADHFGFPIVTLVDTPGAFADLKSEGLNQGEAIAESMFTMFGMKVPIISFIIGEGGSGGALAIACANKLFMLENAVFYVASPEACSAILYKTGKEAPRAASKLRITASELCKLNIADGIVPEPRGGAHNDPHWTSQQIKRAILKTMDELTKMDTQELLKHRQFKFRHIGFVGARVQTDPFKKRNMKKREAMDGLHFKGRILDPGKSFAERVSNETTDAKNLSEGIDEDFFEESEDEGVGKESEDVLVQGEINEEFTGVLDLSEAEIKEEINEEFAGVLNLSEIEKKIEAAKKKIEEFKRGEISEEVDEEFTGVLDPSEAEIKKEVNEEFTGVLNLSEIEKKIEAVNKKIEEFKRGEISEEVDEEFTGVLDSSDIEKKAEALKKEIEDSGVSSLEDLSVDTKRRLLQLKKAVSGEVSDEVSDDHVAHTHVDHTLTLSELRERTAVINHEIKDVINNSPDLMVKMERLQLEVKRAGKRPDLEMRNKIQLLELEIKQGIDEALKSSEKYQKLVTDFPKPEVQTLGKSLNFETMRNMLAMKQQEQGTEDVLNSSENYEKLMAEISEVDQPSGWSDGFWRKM